MAQIELGIKGARICTYERCGLFRKTAIALVEEVYAQMSDLKGLKTRKEVSSLMKVMQYPGDAIYEHPVPASFERYFYLITWAAMHFERCSCDLDMD